ncbi:1-deoxy-D-xylulose-5-phosphate synthase [Desulfococcaceae bacterium HSG7]|nr:1-deoxy-D-xylulose-5-phosphate synthase [Desulfococcaceae bacterium HSG7]
MNFLDKIDSPNDLKRLERTDLPVLADEIRQLIVKVVSENGGHLAPSLGTVELAIAVHYVFNTPDDKVIWDVGHQAYAHKLLTGRRNEFHTLRQHQGISGFTRMSESKHDALTTGHASTSISCGLGMACGKSLKEEKSKVVSIIGDGSMTAGLAYEGLNQAGDIRKDLIVILNDNDMSISTNVGALSSFLSRTLSAQSFQNIKSDIGTILKGLPRIGDDVYQLAKRWEDSVKTFVTPGILFEAFNFDYFGPIQGHNLDHLIDILNNIKHLDQPALLHVKTKKGMGYAPAEKNPTYFHGVGCFEVETGNGVSKSCALPTYTQIFGDTMVELAAADEKIVAVTAAMPEGTGLSEFRRKYPERFYDVGIAEQHGVAFAAGLAIEGLKPVVAIYSTFLQRSFDQIMHDVCIEALPVVFAIDRGGIVGDDGPTHHGLFDLAYLRCLPNMVVMAPGDENELRRMMVGAFEYKGPIAFRYPRSIITGADLDKDIVPLPFGKGKVLKQGDDILILAIGGSVAEALAAHSILEKKGINATIVNCRFVKPLDEDLITALVRKFTHIITVEEHAAQGGFGSAVLECLCDHDITGFHLKRLAVQDSFVEHGPQELLRAKYRIDTTAIVETAMKLLKHAC